MYVNVSPGGGVEGFDWLWLGPSVLAEVATDTSG
jgi:hypothetical protein